MLISYPVLPASAAHDDEDIYLANILEGHLLRYEGNYPVSTITTAQGPMHRWHGGVHLHGGGEPIRAIADGTVVACRFTAKRETYEGLGDYDTGFVLLRHETETGENTPVVFYSLYMHLANQADLAADRLSQLPGWLRQSPGSAVRRPANQRVWRKDVLGFAGQLYNREAMHFEVFMLDADFNRVWRDSTTISSGSGSNDWFGDAHFVIPANRDFVERHPRAVSNGTHRIDIAGSADFALPLGQAGQNEDGLYLSVSLQKGRRVATTYRAREDGSFEQVGHPVIQDEYEYELYRLASALYPDRPSAGFEWLRFGRVLGRDTTRRAENWQLVRYSGTAVGYIDLAADGVAKLSDADFPHWHGWEKRAEGEAANAADGICDDERTLELAQEARSNEAAARKLQHLVCKAPSEWDDSDLPLRYARLRQPGHGLDSEEDWKHFSDHAAKLAFWADAGLSERSVWHFHPLRFIGHFRKCGWLSNEELARCLPRRSLSDPSLAWDTAVERARRHRVHLNDFFRKFKGHSRTRQAHSLAQIYIETGLLRTIAEDGEGAGKPYGPFYGRGYYQLTWAGNYELYGRFKAIPDQAKPTYTDSRITTSSKHLREAEGETMQWSPRFDPHIVEDDLAHAGESGGLYWVSKSFRGRKNMNRVCDLSFDPTSVAFNCWLVNGGSAGYANRQQFAQYLADVLLDAPPRTGSASFSYPPLSPPANPLLCSTFPPAAVAYTLTGVVHYEKQVP